MDHQLQIFNNEQFGQVRMVEIENKPYFVATDIAKALGYVNPRDAIKKHCRWVAKCDVPHPQSENKTLEVNVIPEGDMYRLITNSELPSAEKFESWVFDEVLPSIRKTGTYQVIKNNSKDKKLDLVYKLLSQLPNDKYKNRAVVKILNFIGVENNQIQLPVAKLTREEIDNILDEFLAKEDVILKQTEYGLALNKEKLYKHFEKHGLKWTQTLRILDEYGIIYHKEDCRTAQIRHGIGNPIRVVIIKE